jgi:hypothetical protein
MEPLPDTAHARPTTSVDFSRQEIMWQLAATLKLGDAKVLLGREGSRVANENDVLQQDLAYF